MSQTSGTPQDRPDDDEARRRRIVEVDEQLDAEADGDGLAAEAGRGEEYGLSEG